METFKPSKNRTSLISNEVMMKHRYELSLNAQKVLFGLAQSVDHTLDLFGEIEIDIHAFFDYLAISHRNDRYEVVRDAFKEIAKNPLQFSTEDARRWSFIPWMVVSFDKDDSDHVKIKFTEEAKPFLLQLNGYVKIQGKYITALGSPHATWLYPVMKMIEGKYYGQHVLSIQRLMEYTFTEDKKEHPSYHNLKNGKNNFMSRVLGLKKSSAGYTIIEDSPLGQINKYTDITVSAQPLKTGLTIDRIAFVVQSKKEMKKPLPEKAQPKYGETQNMAFRVPMSQLFELSAATGKTVDVLMREMRYKKSPDGKWAYKANENWVQDQKQNDLFNGAVDAFINNDESQ